MKIAIATKDSWSKVSGHAGQTHDWLVFDCEPGLPIPEPHRIQLSKEQLPHYFQDDGPHPLHGVEIIVAASAGDGYLRHMEKWGAQVLITGEVDPTMALKRFSMVKLCQRLVSISQPLFANCATFSPAINTEISLDGMPMDKD